MSFLRIQANFCRTRKAVIFSLLLFAVFSLSAENFRVRKVIPIEFSQINDKINVESGINDALWITLPKDLSYVSGIELKLKVPEEIITWRDSVAYMLYDSMNPSPSPKSLSYYGERLHVATIPGNFSLNIYVPISKDFSIKDNPYSEILPSPKDYIENGIFLRFMMVMKGVPESLENSILEITAKPVFKNKGALNLVTTPQSSAEKSYSVFIDDLPVQDYSHKLLSTGEHHLSIISDSYRNELRTFRIEQAKTTTLSVNLRGIEPLLKLVCPKDTAVFLDGSQIKATAEPFIISQGEHTVKFILGDYEIIKTISAQNGRTYSVNLNVDASVSEED